jgi:hypothetical protein
METGRERVGVTLYVRSFFCRFRYSVATRTLFNSKGLEYDDVSPIFRTNAPSTLTPQMCVSVKVILYNFFGDSALDNLWKYLMDDGQHKIWDSKYAPLIHEASDKISFPDTRHQKLTFWLWQLKCLYVAITRAKHRLWIVDYSDSCEPIMVCIVQRCFVVRSLIYLKYSGFCWTAD